MVEKQIEEQFAMAATTREWTTIRPSCNCQPGFCSCSDISVGRPARTRCFGRGGASRQAGRPAADRYGDAESAGAIPMTLMACVSTINRHREG